MSERHGSATRITMQSAGISCNAWRRLVHPAIMNPIATVKSDRNFMKFLSLFTVAVGFMMAGWTKRRQALHDIPADCVVIRVAPPSLSLFGKQS